MTITVCMGSSCFSRGNATNAETVQNLIEKMGLQDKVEIRGCLCEGLCKKGPNVRINDTVYSNVSPDSLENLIQHELSNASGE